MFCRYQSSNITSPVYKTPFVTQYVKLKHLKPGSHGARFCGRTPTDADQHARRTVGMASCVVVCRRLQRCAGIRRESVTSKVRTGILCHSLIFYRDPTAMCDKTQNK
ncbi:hypothetical protein B5X24_HaOG207362 [Helicoverpa armigera]|uniref:Uncharacterized protein n=1 Tax=Helicoverpa armigera TaxID=29058 RepID=A0A2W1BSI5_HELAM|nr:hypothetical protein B5X24_HaOG207362 [Helicoverpa armigera]